MCLCSGVSTDTDADARRTSDDVRVWRSSVRVGVAAVRVCRVMKASPRANSSNCVLDVDTDSGLRVRRDDCRVSVLFRAKGEAGVEKDGFGSGRNRLSVVWLSGLCETGASVLLLLAVEDMDSEDEEAPPL